MKDTIKLDLALIHRLLCFDDQTGVLTYKVNRYPRIKAGKEAGCIASNGYRKIAINGITMLGHRVGFAMHFGYWPDRQIDHINGKRDDNRIINLRLTTQQENMRNRKSHKNNTSGQRGVTWNKSIGKWQSQIGHGGKIIYLGVYDNFEIAKQAYQKASQELHGEFANQNR